MTLLHRLHAELDRPGSASHPIARTLPHLLREHRRWRLLISVSLFLAGQALGTGIALWVLWHRIDAVQGSTERLALACLNPGKAQVTTKAKAQVMTTEIERRERP